VTNRIKRPLLLVEAAEITMTDGVKRPLVERAEFSMSYRIESSFLLERTEVTVTNAVEWSFVEAGEATVTDAVKWSFVEARETSVPYRIERTLVERSEFAMAD